METKVFKSKGDLKFRRKLFDLIWKGFVYFIAFTSILLIIFVIFFVLREAFLLISKGYINSHANLSNLFSYIWQPVSIEPKYGTIPLIIGSLKVMIVATLIASPLAVFAALYVSVYASDFLRETIKPIIELIAGLPSVVIGFFMLMVAATFLQNVFGWDFRLNAIVGGIGVALAIIPVIFTISEDAMRSIPKHLIESAYALGASRHHVAWKIVLPSSLSAVFSSIIFAASRAFGETMIVLMATGNAPIPSFDFTLPVRTVSATIASEMAEVQIGDEHYAVLFFIGFMLLVATLIFNLISNYVYKYIKSRLGV
jgi:phosphate transport system permease protein